MLGLPKSTEVNKQLPKTAIYTKFQMNSSEKTKIDDDISKITIVNEVTSGKINIYVGQSVKSFFVLHIILKRKNFDDNTIIKISKLIPQNILFVLQFENMAKLAVYQHIKLIQTDWQDDINITLNGLNLDVVWENIIKDIEGGSWSENLSLEENIELHQKQEKLKKEIAKLEKQARAEKQPRKKFDLVQKLNKLKHEMERIK